MILSLTRRDALAALGLLTGTAALAACTSRATGDSRTPAQLTIAQGNDILSLDPADHGNNSTESALVNIYDYLVNKDFSSGELTFVEGLATSWEQSDELTWLFQLRDGVTWHDGEPFSAQDVVFTVERLQGDDTLRSAGKFSTISEITAVDDTTVQVVTDGPDSLLLHRFVGNGAGILPAKALGASASEEDFFAAPVGTGPYTFSEWVKGDRLALEANDAWWGGEPVWEEVVIRAIPETATRVSELLTGGVDLAVNIPPEDDDRINAGDGAVTAAFDIARNIALHVRTGEDWATADIRVREAIDLAIDRTTIAEKVASGLASPARGFFPRGIPGHHEQLNQDIPFDPDRARELLAEAGKSDGVTLRFSTPSGRYLKDREIAEAIVGYLAEVGITAELEVLEWTVYNDKLSSDEFGELYLWGMGSYTDGSSLFNGDFDTHYAWQDDEFDELAEKARTARSDEDRIAASLRGQEIIAEQRVRIGIVFPQSNIGLASALDFAGRFDEMIPAQEISPR